MRYYRAAYSLFFVLLIFSSVCCIGPLKTEKQNGAVTAILGAFDKEVELIREQLDYEREINIEGVNFVTGTLAGKHVVVVWTGIGKVNTAMTTTLLLEHFRPEQVIFTGIAGAVNPELGPGDIIIAEQTAFHDMGTMWDNEIEYHGVTNRLNGFRNPVFFPADENLLKIAQTAAQNVKLNQLDTSVGDREPKIREGIVVTGDVFVSSPVQSKKIRESLGADAVEMEGAAVAQLCFQRKIPHIIIRSITDNADENARNDSFRFQQTAVENSAKFINEIVKLLGGIRKND